MPVTTFGAAPTATRYVQGIVTFHRSYVSHSLDLFCFPGSLFATSVSTPCCHPRSFKLGLRGPQVFSLAFLSQTQKCKQISVFSVYRDTHLLLTALAAVHLTFLTNNMYTAWSRFPLLVASASMTSAAKATWPGVLDAAPPVAVPATSAPRTGQESLARLRCA